MIRNNLLFWWFALKWPYWPSRRGGHNRWEWSWSLGLSWVLGVGLMSPALIILTQWSSEHCSFCRFKKEWWRKPWFSDQRCSTKYFWMKPTQNLLICLYLPGTIGTCDLLFYTDAVPLKSTKYIKRLHPYLLFWSGKLSLPPIDIIFWSCGWQLEVLLPTLYTRAPFSVLKAP